MHRRITAWLVTTLAAGVLLGSTGCNEMLPGSHMASFSAGWLVRGLTMPATTETLCYRNGELVDCSEVEQ